MSDVARYQRGEQLRRDGEFVTSRGVDPVTGLAVMIYDFPGPPRVKPSQFQSAGAPAILAAGYDGSRGVLVTAYPSGATLVAPGEGVVDDQFVLQALTTLRDAARAGLVHGDLNSGRFLWAGGRLYLEGYGVPWNNSAVRNPTKEVVRAALARDLAAGVKALLELGSSGVSAEVTAALKGALANAIRAGDAAQLHAVVRRLAGGAVTVPPAGFADLMLPTTGAPATPGGGSAARADDPLEPYDLADLDMSRPADRPRGGSDDLTIPLSHRGGAAAERPAPRAEGRAEQELFETPSHAGVPATPTYPDEPDPITLNSDPGVVLTLPKGDESGPGFVKDLPPGATYRAGNPEEEVRSAPIRFDVGAVPAPRKRTWRGPLLLLALLAVTLVASYLAVVAQRDAGTDLPGSGTVSHIVDVRVEPGNLPPASLVVERSPSGSAYGAGTIIASVPRRVRFDANGNWTVHATYQGRRSESVTLRVPEESQITIAFPEEGE